MTDNEIKVMLIEDSKIDARIIRKLLDKQNYKIEWCEELSKALIRLENERFDVILLDLNLPDSKGLDTFINLQSKKPDVPIVIQTVTDDESIAVKAVRKGAQDYLIKGQITSEMLTRVIRYAIERKEIEKELIEHRDHLEVLVDKRTAEISRSQERFRRMAENIHDGLTILEDGKVVYLNDRACEIFGYPREELANLTYLDLAVPEEQKRLKQIMDAVEQKGMIPGELEFWIVQKNDTRRYIRNRYSTDHGDKMKSNFIITTDITDRKIVEEEMKKRLMTFLLENGYVYLVKENYPELSVEAFKDLLKMGYDGLIVSRTPKQDWRRTVQYPFNLIWLGEGTDTKSIQTVLEDIKCRIGDMVGNSVVLIDRLDYLIVKIGLEEALSFVFGLRDIVYLAGPIVILSIDPSVVTEEQLHMLEKETREIELQKVQRPSEEGFEIVQFIHEKNKVGVKPSYTMVSEELRISKPTSRKRIRSLITSGYVVEVEKGNKKILELTQKGRTLFFR